MVKREALMESLSSNLNDFLKKIANNLSVPDKKFLRDIKFLNLVSLLITWVTVSLVYFSICGEV